ncbi:MAG: hypothetical protein JWR51_4716 [Devosia sp.]|nr:hypothetical protein [Devosia sp.]
MRPDVDEVVVAELGNGVVLMQEGGHGVPCTTCSGDGYISSPATAFRPAGRPSKCRYCQGRGYVVDSWTDIFVPKMNDIPLSARSRHLMTEPVQLLLAERTKSEIWAAWEAENGSSVPA